MILYNKDLTRLMDAVKAAVESFFAPDFGPGVPKDIEFFLFVNPQDVGDVLVSNFEDFREGYLVTRTTAPEAEKDALLMVTRS